MNITFEEAMVDYFKYLKHKLKYTTYETDIRKINLYILSFFKYKNIYDLTSKDYLDWQYYIDSFNFKYNYKSSIHYTFSSFLDYCMIFYDLPLNVARKVGNFKNDEIINSGNVWSLEEYNQFIEVVDDIVYKTLFELLYFTGLRKGEALALTWKDINFMYSSIVVNKQITRFSNNGKKILISPKTTSSNRKLCIDNELLNDLKELKNFYQYNYVNFNDSWFVFGGTKSISFTQLKRKKDFYCDIAEVKIIKIHEFRHSHACLLFKNNVPIEDISYRLGHSSISMTMDTYLKYLPKDEKRVINTLNSIKTNN